MTQIATHRAACMNSLAEIISLTGGVPVNQVAPAYLVPFLPYYDDVADADVAMHDFRPLEGIFVRYGNESERTGSSTQIHTHNSIDNN